MRKLVVEGLRDLADIVQKDENIQKITAESWIVGKSSKIMEKLGFQISSEEGRKVTDKRELGEEIKKAEISREDFLKKYLKK